MCFHTGDIPSILFVPIFQAKQINLEEWPLWVGEKKRGIKLININVRNFHKTEHFLWFYTFLFWTDIQFLYILWSSVHNKCMYIYIIHINLSPRSDETVIRTYAPPTIQVTMWNIYYNWSATYVIYSQNYIYGTVDTMLVLQSLINRL